MAWFVTWALLHLCIGCRAPRSGGHIAGTGGAVIDPLTATDTAHEPVTSDTSDAVPRASQHAISGSGSGSGRDSSAGSALVPHVHGAAALQLPGRERQVPKTPQVLTKRFASDLASEDGTIIVTVAAAGKLDLLLNWVGHLDKLGECGVDEVDRWMHGL